MNTTTQPRQATPAEIRQHYVDMGHRVRITQDGRVEFKRDGEGTWLHGRYVNEYRFADKIGVYIK